MRMAAIDHRAVGLAGDRAWDIAEASGGAFGPDPMQVLGRWDEFLAWAADNAPAGGEAYRADDLTCPVPRPPQVFGIGLNYADHAGESGMEVPDDPLVFTKFPSCMAAPNAEVPLVPGNCDWEVELVVVIGRAGRDIAAGDIADHIAGFTVGQDVSERIGQFAGGYPQFNLGKSHRNFSPVGPAVVTLDELENPWDLGLTCSVNGVMMQDARTTYFINDVPRLITYLSSICELLPGDIIFTGTPSGVGFGMDPPQYLAPGDVIVSTIEGLGEITNRCV
ncbi:MAG: fumarylacetoacetate hydrolase family protein [bacterium]|nr:fumarylacetoacetate hydrolase family protein [bacterium]MXV91006.1 fumarylacetoacetate hydrolase family protein [Acidimicrobiia bacterium]MYC44581.1 fumarylacetoacetate hydrolase family protein [Acidimicrobiia bacterium]MYI19746.1 fumarylacetoacetate hydrolase family protein [Acidimicrobiia bacterium]